MKRVFQAYRLAVAKAAAHANAPTGVHTCLPDTQQLEPAHVVHWTAVALHVAKRAAVSPVEGGPVQELRLHLP